MSSWARSYLSVWRLPCEACFVLLCRLLVLTHLLACPPRLGLMRCRHRRRRWLPACMPANTGATERGPPVDPKLMHRVAILKEVGQIWARIEQTHLAPRFLNSSSKCDGRQQSLPDCHDFHLYRDRPLKSGAQNIPGTLLKPRGHLCNM